MKKIFLIVIFALAMQGTIVPTLASAEEPVSEKCLNAFVEKYMKLQPNPEMRTVFRMDGSISKASFSSSDESITITDLPCVDQPYENWDVKTSVDYINSQAARLQTEEVTQAYFNLDQQLLAKANSIKAEFSHLNRIRQLAGLYNQKDILESRLAQAKKKIKEN